MWQAATVLLAAGAVGLVVLPLARALKPMDANWDGVGVRPAGMGNNTSDNQVLSLADASNLADILGELSPKAPDVETPPDGPEDIGQPDENLLGPTRLNPTDAPPADAARANWVYLGSAVTPRASRALVRIDQSQKFIRLGTEFDGVKLVEVHDDYIMVEEGPEDARLQKRIDRAPLLADAMLAPPRTGAPTRTAQTPPVPTPAGSSAIAKAREDALAAAQAAHGRLKVPADKPDQTVTRIQNLPAELRVQTYTTLTSTTASYEDKLRALSELGLGDATGDQRREAMKALGLDPESPEIQRLLEDEMAGSARDDR